MERKQIQAEIKADGEPGSITGYGSVFGNIDLGGDIVQRGAFAESLKRRKPTMLLGHNPDAVLGVWDEVREDDCGLFMRGRINLDTQLGRDAHSNIKMSAMRGMSIGFSIPKGGYEFDKSDNRLINQAELFEVSVVSMPMNEEAQISAVKAMDDGDFTQIKRILERAARDAGLSAREAKGAAAAAADHLSTARDAGKGVSEVVRDLRELVKIKTG